MKKGSIITAFASAIIIILMFFIIYMLFSSAEQKTGAYSQATLEVGKFYIFNKIMTSRNCISTGETGVLDKSLLDAADASGEELECAYLADYTHYVKVDNLTNGEGWDWTFGYVGSSAWEESVESYVAISDGNDVFPGLLKVILVSSDPSIEDDEEDVIVCLTGGAERAWTKGESNVNCYVDFTTGGSERLIDFKQDEICLKNPDGSTIRCRPLKGAARLSPTTKTVKGWGAKQTICVSYIKQGGVVKVKDFSLYPC